MNQQFQDANWEELVALKERVDKIYEGRLNWPMPSLPQAFDPAVILPSSREEIIALMKNFFKIMGPAVEEFVILSGYWDDKLTDEKLGMRADKLVRHHLRYDYIRELRAKTSCVNTIIHNALEFKTVGS